MKQFFKELGKFSRADLSSGFIVFLVALPLSLGIAMASGVPPVAGLIAAVMGGVLGSLLGGGNVSINGPAAGLIVVVLHGVETLGQGNVMAGYRAVLACAVLAGIILILLGKVLKAGRLGNVFPSSAVHGMLAAIGVIIISKQIHVALGVVASAKSPFGLLAEVPRSLAALNPEIALIGAVCLFLLVGIPLLPWKWVTKVPTAMIVVLVGMLMGRFFDLEHQHTYLFLPEHEYTIGPDFLVSLPESILGGLVFPDFRAILKPGFFGVLMTLTIIQSLETLLSASAVDKFDLERRTTNLDRELTAVGVASVASAAIGGLPVITEIVRSRANVAAGAKSWRSNFLHGVFVLLFVVLFPSLLHQIPLAALASILMVTGYRLASPSQFKHSLELGVDQLVIFATTFLVTLGTDLLVGVASGVLMKVLFHLARGLPLKLLFKSEVEVSEGPDGIRIFLKKGAVFSNFLGVKRHLDSIPLKRRVQIDVTSVTFIDHTVMEKLHEFISQYNERGGDAGLVGLESLTAHGNHELSARGIRK